MPSAHDFLVALALVLGVASVTTLLFHRLKQPIVLGYLVAGVLVGPHFAAFPFTADTQLIQALSELGVILLMFCLGLEFRFAALRRVGSSVLLTGLFECSALVGFGVLVGRAFGFSPIESVFVGATVAISSTTIVARAFEELQVKDPVRGLVIGVLLVEDLLAVVLMASLTALATGAALSVGSVGMTLARLGGFLAVLVVGGLIVVPRLMRVVLRQGRVETLVVTAIALAFGFALLAHEAGYSVALGAFIAGSLVAESGEGHRVSVAVQPVRDLFAAVFFVSVGMLLDPTQVAQHWGLVLALAALVVVGKSVFVSLGFLFTGNGVRTSAQAGLSLAQIGEFSFIIASLGLTVGATNASLYPVAVAVSALTTWLTPTLIRKAPRWADGLDRRLPPRVQTLVSMYASWLERLGTRPDAQSPVRKLVRLLALDASCLVGTVVVLALVPPLLEGVMRWALLGVAVVLLVTFGVGLARVLRRLSEALAQQAMPAVSGLDLARAPRATLAALLRVVCALGVLAPALAVLTPLLPPLWLALTTVVVLLALLWSSVGKASDFDGHLRAGAEVVAEALGAVGPGASDALSEVRAQLPGLGEPVTCQIPEHGAAVGQTLGALNVRGVTGATVLAIHRATGAVVLPVATERLQAGDVLALAGTQGAVDAARMLLVDGGR